MKTSNLFNKCLVVAISLEQLIYIKRKFSSLGVDSYDRNVIESYKCYPDMLRNLSEGLDELERYTITSNLPLDYREKTLEKIKKIRSDFMIGEYKSGRHIDSPVDISNPYKQTKGSSVIGNECCSPSIIDVIKRIVFWTSLGLNVRLVKEVFFNSKNSGGEDEKK